MQLASSSSLAREDATIGLGAKFMPFLMPTKKALPNVESILANADVQQHVRVPHLVCSYAGAP